MRLTLPWPAPCLFPNAKRRYHWRVYSGPAKAAKAAAYWLAKEAGVKVWRSDDRPRLTVTFAPPNRIRRDHDGCIGASKHFLDGLAMAMDVDDSRFLVSYDPEFAEPVKGGAVIVEVQP